MATTNNGWSAPSPQPMAQQAGADEFGVQTRPMGREYPLCTCTLPVSAVP